MSLPSNSALTQMRTQAAQFWNTPVAVYSVTIGYSTYGQQIVSSGLRFSATGYVGAITGSDAELLQTMGLIGAVKETKITVLIPFGNDFLQSDIVRINNKDYRVIWSSAETQDNMQVYSKAICAEYLVTEEKRRSSNG